ncbi:MAG: RNase RNM [Aeromonas sp.]
MRFDLHSHSTASDGHLSPSDLVRRAAQMQVDVLALTDHDTLAGLEEARATMANENLPLRLIAGCELSTTWQNHEIHIVGLGVNTDEPTLRAFLTAQSARRRARAEEIGARLSKHNLPDTYPRAQALAGEGAVTRAHFARVLVELGAAPSLAQVFKKYLSRGNPGYVPPVWPEMDCTIAAIQAAGGVAVLAHASRYDLSTKWVKRLIGAFKAAGGQAMEVSLSQQTPVERANLGQWASEHDLAISVGSDFHFIAQWTELGRHLWLPKQGEPVWLRYPQAFALSASEITALTASR